jgi:multiple antibiotic resistance protein
VDLLKPLYALLAIVNPIGVVPFFIHFTQNLSPEQRRRTIQVSAFTGFVVIAVSALAGLRIIEFFGISIASFQVGGGTLLLISSLSMLNAQPAESKPGDMRDGDAKVGAGASIAVVPLAIPLLTGPATISTIVIYAEKTRFLWQLGVLVLYGVVIGLITYVVFSASGRIAKVLGRIPEEQRHRVAVAGHCSRAQRTLGHQVLGEELLHQRREARRRALPVGAGLRHG